MNWTGRIVLLLAIATSVSLFWRKFGRVLRIIRESKPDADFQLRPIGPRIRKVLWEVGAQGLVIAQRPLPGLAHAFVFWGFCVFALVTLNHFASAFGLGFLSRSGFGRFYFWFAGAFAVAVAVSIAGLAFRRFVIRPKWLEPLSPESGLIAFLIFALMVTYLAAFFVPEGGAAELALWWAHTLVLLAFLPLIPKTKHMHLVLSPLTIFLERDGFSRIPPLVGDEDFGLDTGKDLTRIASLQAYSCVECGRCTEHCPANNTGKVLNPKEIILGTRHYLNEFGPKSGELLLGKHLSMEAAFQCTTCGACEYQCPVGIQHLPIIVGLRRGAVNTGKWDNPHGSELFVTLERHGNALGFAPSERQKFIEKNNLPYFDGTQEYCLWMGCLGSYDPNGRKIVLALAEVLRYLGITFGVLKQEKCSGDPVRRLGNDYLFGELAQQNLEQINESKATKLVSICPHCVRTIGTDWKEHGANVAIEHHTELLARYRDQLPAGGDGQSVVFHDACYLGRYRGIYDQPRDVISRFGKVVDPPRARERGFCCGGGGGLMFLGEETGKRVNLERAQELAGTGAKVVAAACPFCNSMLRDGLAANSATPPELLDVVQIAAAAIQKQT
ncbi:membrane-bound electron transfer flavoprotein:quinone oxidoreductase [Candidatus Sulfotelmatobacter kueseliae]|uniref:Membrane-bound electron transfer flavoprotein:quinone oxidoreductase n=1 Tax=Candidatus Sulfotelmatobacter kueseliae TaxID=2042962 RepID=A0A2U3L4D5_9BACT|nr:membrane-bound electron transfer flavoprotein:quinone oxidoreductase [Candidatus Sulfotelmatobacter kueseliae]